MLNRRLRGMFGLAAVWGTALAALSTSSLLIGLATGYVPREIFPPVMIAVAAVRGLLVGGLSGALFGWFLSVRERNRTVSTLSLKRAALWGFAAAAAVPTTLLGFSAAGALVPLPIMAISVGIAGIGGGLFGAGLLRAARRDDRKLASAVDEFEKLPR